MKNRKLFRRILILLCLTLLLLAVCRKKKPVPTVPETASFPVITTEAERPTVAPVPQSTEAPTASPATSAPQTEADTQASDRTEPETAAPEDPAQETTPSGRTVTEDGQYSSKEEVALYLHLYGHLPSNYLTKSEAEDRGWVASKGNLWKVTDHMSIGGDRFGNREGNLPTKKGRRYFECDIDYQGGRRGAKRIIYSNDGLIYYTEDHYETFTLLYGDE